MAIIIKDEIFQELRDIRESNSEELHKAAKTIGIDRPNPKEFAEYMIQHPELYDAESVWVAHNYLMALLLIDMQGISIDLFQMVLAKKDEKIKML
jgi:hypothetical protein